MEISADNIVRKLGEFTESGEETYVKSLVRELCERVIKNNSKKIQCIDKEGKL